MNYIIASDYMPADGSADVSGALQALIDQNPNRTIFFPDGVYLLSKPICTPANPAHAVSLKLATFAKLKAMDTWTEKEALVRLGAAEPFNDINANGSNYYFEGGILDGSGKATQAELLKNKLKDKGYEIFSLDLPYYDDPSSTLVKMYLNGDFGGNAFH